MALNLRNDLIKASKIHFEAHIEKHRINVENLLNNSQGVAEHADIMDTIEKELQVIAEYDDKLNVLKKIGLVHRIPEAPVDKKHKKLAISVQVAFEKGNVIGYASIHYIKKITRKSGIIEDVVVKENQRGKGIGKLLVNNLIEKAKKNNCDKIILSSSEKNLKFYQKLGFQKNEFEMIMRI